MKGEEDIDHDPDGPTLRLEWTVSCPKGVKDAFQQLPGDTEEKRTEASMVILKYLKDAMQEGPEHSLSDSVMHIIIRLVSGLYSERPYAREAYYTTLQAVLQLHPSIVHYVQKVWAIKFPPEVNLNNKEKLKTKLMGEVLYYGALIRSGCVSSMPIFSGKMIRRLLVLREKVDYLDIMATQFLVNLLEKNGDQITNKVEVWEHVEPFTKEIDESDSPSCVWLHLVMKRMLSTKDNPSLEVKWKFNTRILAASIMSTVSCLPNVHPLLGEVVRSLEPKNENENNLLISLWKNIVKHHLSQCAVKDLQLILSILQLVVPKLRTPKEVTKVVRESTVALLITSLSRQDHDLRTAAQGLASALLHLVASNEHYVNLQLAVVEALIVPPGSIRFDELTGTKLLAQMMSHFSLAALKKFAKLLQDLSSRALEADNHREARGLAMALKNLIYYRGLSSDEEIEWRLHQLKAVMKVALFFPDYMPGILEIRAAFSKAVAYCGGKTLENYYSLLGELLRTADEELQLQKAKGKSPLDVAAATRWAEVLEKMAVLQSDNMKDTIPSQVFQLLYGQMGFHLFFDPKYAKEIIGELHSCYQEMRKSVNKDNSSSEEERGEELYWVDVVTELLINFMGHGDHNLRFIAKGAFGLLCPLATMDTITLIVDVLDMEKARQLVDDLMDDSDEEEEEMETEEEGMDDKETNEEDGNEDKLEEENGKEDKMEEEDGREDADEDENKDSESSDDDSDFDEEATDEKERVGIAQLRDKLMAEMDNFDITDVDMDSMPVSVQNKLDMRLGAVFAEFRRSRYGEVNKLTLSDRSILHFQNRACDLLQVFICSKPKMSMVLNLLIPFFKAAEQARQKWILVSLQSRIVNLIKLMMKHMKRFEKDVKFDSVLEIWNDFFITSLEFPDNMSQIIEQCYEKLLLLCVKLHEEEEEDKSASGSDNPVITAYLQHLDKILATELTAAKVLRYLSPCTIQCDGLDRVAEVMIHTAFNPAVKTYKRLLALQGLQKLYRNNTFLEKKSKQLDKEVAEAMVKMLSEFSTPGVFLKRILNSFFELILLLYKYDEKAGGSSVFKWDLVKPGLVSVRQNVAKKDMRSFLKVYRKLRTAFHIPVDVCGGKPCPVSKKSQEKQMAQEKKEKKKMKRKQWQMKVKEKKNKEEKAKQARKERIAKKKGMLELQTKVGVISKYEDFDLAL